LEYRILGRTGIKVSAVGLGCSQIRGTLPPGEKGWTGLTDEEAISCIRHAPTVGVNLIDTAEVYAYGHSEDIIGRAMEGHRHEYVVATKVTPLPGAANDPFYSTDLNDTAVYRRIVQGCEDSLRRLRTDYIDVYQLHADPPDETIATVMEAMTRLKKEGKIRAIGSSTGNVNVIRKLIEAGELGMVQTGYSLLHRDGANVLNLAIAENLGVLLRNPIASGALSGKYFHTTPRLDPADKRNDWFTSESAADAFRKLSELRFLTEDGRRTMVQAALRFDLDTPGVTAPIPGVKNRRQLEENAGAAEVPPLTCEERRRAIAIANEAMRIWKGEN
jgi:aryl-alcohol dehydrogenase-like predicted oxidoreductase